MDPDRMAALRVKLGSLSFFMQALNQPIAIAANKEDGCTGKFWEGRYKGKFWEGRYKCQRLTDDSAVLSAMTYVDLNPIRAGMADDLPSSEHTTARLRTERIGANKRVASFGLKPVAGLCQQQLLDMTGQVDCSIPARAAKSPAPPRQYWPRWDSPSGAGKAKCAAPRASIGAQSVALIHFWI